MVKDHTKAAKQLMNIIKKEGDTPPADALAPKDAETMKQLQAASGADFDKAYVSAQQKAHMDAVALFKNYSDNPDDKRLGRFAKKTLPTLEMHLDHAKKLTASQ
jgi:putative membrane protein